MQSATTKESSRSCIAATTAILGDKWTPLIIRALADAPQRFCHLQDTAGGINPRTLSARLSDLESHNIIQKHPIKQSNHFEYALSKKGEDLLPVLDAMTMWGNKYAPTR